MKSSRTPSRSRSLHSAMRQNLYWPSQAHAAPLSLLVVFFNDICHSQDSDMQTTQNSEDEGAYSTDLPSSLELMFTSRVDNSKREDENDAGTCRRRSTLRSQLQPQIDKFLQSLLRIRKPRARVGWSDCDLNLPLSFSM